MLGFRFDGRHCGDFGIVMKSKNRPILPKPKRVTEEVSTRDGVYDFSAANPYGRVMYNQREITVDCSLMCGSPEDLRQRARRVAEWLAVGEAALIFDDEPSVRYLAAVSNRIDLQQQITKIGSFTLVFDCRPFGYSTILSGEVPSYGGGGFYGDRSQYGGDNIFTATLSGVTPQGGEGAFSFNVKNLGTYVAPVIEVSGTFDNLRIISREIFLQFPQNASGFLQVDCHNKKAVLNDTNILNLISGTFFTLAPGDNPMSLTGGGLDCELRFVFHHQYL